MYQVTWLVRNKVIFFRCEGVVTSQELKSGASIMHAMLVGINEPVHCIVDSRELVKFPMSISDCGMQANAVLICRPERENSNL